MRRWLTLIGTLMLAVMIWTGTTAHAAEALGCVEVSADSFGHFDGDKDEVPNDSDKAVPHHHGGCHGHHVAVTGDGGTASPSPAEAVTRILGIADRIPDADPGTVLRPPIA
ncbi:MAG: hypothetical protein ACT4N8_09640 [Sphingosinicella sp.]|uniref:hypothetical protein n=1 Tax=Sphingosinicella sp. TaxID=1917971 RepID=UPI0040382CB4